MHFPLSTLIMVALVALWTMASTRPASAADQPPAGGERVERTHERVRARHLLGRHEEDPEAGRVGAQARQAAKDASLAAVASARAVSYTPLPLPPNSHV